MVVAGCLEWMGDGLEMAKGGWLYNNGFLSAGEKERSLDWIRRSSFLFC